MLGAICHLSRTGPNSGGVYLETASTASLQFYYQNGFKLHGEGNAERSRAPGDADDRKWANSRQSAKVQRCGVNRPLAKIGLGWGWRQMVRAVRHLIGGR